MFARLTDAVAFLAGVVLILGATSAWLSSRVHEFGLAAVVAWAAGGAVLVAQGVRGWRDGDERQASAFAAAATWVGILACMASVLVAFR